MSKHFSSSATLAVVCLLLLATTILGGHPADVLADDPTGVSPDLESAAYVPGRTYWGRNNYIEYIAGDLPIIISAPHGGTLRPKEIPDRTWGMDGGIDTNSQEYTRELARYLYLSTGHYPHVIINHLHRSKLDANRDIKEGAQGSWAAEQAWYEFHRFIDASKASVRTRWGKGLYLDLHTNGHPEKWLELGYSLSATDLSRSNQSLNSSTYKNQSSVRNLAYTTGAYFPELIRGWTSLGGHMQRQGYKTVPSPGYPSPGRGGYFPGGYNTFRHGSLTGGSIDGVQVEAHWASVQKDVRYEFSRSLGNSILRVMELYYGFKLRSLIHRPYKVYMPMVTKNRR
jgi:hypothetical protein